MPTASEISELLFEHDPMGLNFGDNTDEYDAEAEAIASRLKAGMRAQRVCAIVHEEFRRWFAPMNVGDANRYQTIARQLAARL